MKKSHWALAIVLLIGAVLATAGVHAQRSLPLRAPLQASVPRVMEGYNSVEVTLPDDQLRVVGVTDYLARVFEPVDTAQAAASYFALYVGYYDRQTRGRTIHSPRNCLPGAGWEPLTNTTAVIETPSGPVTVNRYLLQKGERLALVLYWYQGRGRVASNEYVVKWDLLRDAALTRRSDEALVRLVVPVENGERAAFELAARLAGQIVPAVGTSLPS